jgi:hypothetical protein
LVVVHYIENAPPSLPKDQIVTEYCHEVLQYTLERLEKASELSKKLKATPVYVMASLSGYGGVEKLEAILADDTIKQVSPAVVDVAHEHPYIIPLLVPVLDDIDSTKLPLSKYDAGRIPELTLQVNNKFTEWANQLMNEVLPEPSNVVAISGPIVRVAAYSEAIEK